MWDIRKKIIELIELYMYKDLSEGVLYETTTWRICSLWDWNDIFIDIEPDWIYERWEDWRDKDKIIWHYDINAIWGYINSINLWWVWPYYFDSVAISKDYYILTPTWDNDYARIPNKPLHLYTEQEEKDLLDLLLKLK